MNSSAIVAAVLLLAAQSSSPAPAPPAAATPAAQAPHEAGEKPPAAAVPGAKAYSALFKEAEIRAKLATEVAARKAAAASPKVKCAMVIIPAEPAIDPAFARPAPDPSAMAIRRIPAPCTN